MPELETTGGIEGKLIPPYGGQPTCQLDSCQKDLNEEIGAFLHKDRESGKFVVFCGDCSYFLQINSLRFPIVNV